MAVLWLYYGYTMAVLWLYCGYTMAVLWLYYGPARYLRRCTEGDCIPRREGLLLLHLHKYDFQVRARVSGYGLGSGLAAATLRGNTFTHSLITHYSP